MGDVATLQEIAEWLQLCRSYLEQGRWDFVPRKKNIDALARLAWKPHHVKQILEDLCVTDYVQGPLLDQDANQSSDFFVFGCTIDGTEFYIKCKCDVYRGCVCLSFHPAERPLHYPKR